MIINIAKTPEENGKNAADKIAQLLNDAIKEKGEARLLLSTGASQFEMFDNLVGLNVDWGRVEMFHLDEYINLPETHIASFRKYLKERFIGKVNLKEAHLVDGEGEYEEKIKSLSAKIAEKPVDVAAIGIGENGHVAFNDPPANFETEEPYIVVNLDKKCKLQQVGEGWFNSIEDVPSQAVSMSVRQIMKSRAIVSVVPHAVKSWAVKNTVTLPVTNAVPATILKTHENWSLFIDFAAAEELLGKR